MAYTQDDFEDWIILIDFKMDYFTGEFAKEQNLKLDYSIESLDEIEGWILANYRCLIILRFILVRHLENISEGNGTLT